MTSVRKICPIAAVGGNMRDYPCCDANGCDRSYYFENRFSIPSLMSMFDGVEVCKKDFIKEKNTK